MCKLLRLGGATASGASPKTKRLPPLKIDGKDHLPFQLQIEYTGKDGSRCVRVISQAKPVTTDRTIAEKGEGVWGGGGGGESVRGGEGCGCALGGWA